MRLNRPIVHILVAAVALIAAYLVPSAVEAHPGHHHPEPAQVTLADVSLDDIAGAFAADASSRTGASVAASASGAGVPTPGKACNGLCCASSGLACCAHALVADQGAAVPDAASARAPRLADTGHRPGVDPEALPKPPRTFA